MMFTSRPRTLLALLVATACAAATAGVSTADAEDTAAATEFTITTRTVP